MLFKIRIVRKLIRMKILRSYLNIRIFGRDQEEAEDQPAVILKYVEDLRRGLNADTCPFPADRTKRPF